MQKKVAKGQFSYLETGVDKIANTFVFTGNASLEADVMGGLLQFSNQYRGSAFRTTTTAVRDDETATLSLEHGLGGDFSSLVRGSWVLSRDNRSIGLSSLQRINGGAGVRYQPNPTLWAELLGGVESTTQLGVENTGPLASATVTLAELSIDQLLLSGSALADWHRVDATRTNADLAVHVLGQHLQPDGSYVRVGLGGDGLQREFLTTLSGGSMPDAVESRNEQRADGMVDVLYYVLPELSLGLTGSINLNGIGRGYAAPVIGSAVSAVQRHLDEFVLNIQGSATYRTERVMAMAQGTLYRRTEDNTVRQHFPLSVDDLAELGNQEYQRDNRASRARFYAIGAWMPNATDTLSVEYTGWLLQYDTPSSLNNDDRDELSVITSMRYARKVSDILSVGLSAGVQYLHTVYLKAARSAFNNQNNVLRLSPFVKLTTRTLSMHPVFEVLANYTVYDFEGKGAQAHSYGYRQISYRDSIRIQLTNQLRCEVPVLARYFERSTLLWDAFAEIPQAGTLEYLVNTRLFAQPSLTWDVGVGVRWYTFEQASLMNTPGIPSIIGSIRSWAPEVVVRFRPLSGSTLDVSGWYEFQTLIPQATRELPNLLLHARIAL